MSAPARTDRLSAIEAPEFVWEDDGESELHRMLVPRLLDMLAQAGCRSVLDLGCGNGYLSGLLARQGYMVLGLDHSSSGIALARAHHPGAVFEQHDLAVPLPEVRREAFDCVISIEVIEHLPLPRALLRAAWSALRPGGTMILSTPYHGYWKNLSLALAGRFDAHWHPLRDYGHIKFFSRRTLLQLFAETGFVQMRYATLGRIPPLARSMLVSARKPA